MNEDTFFLFINNLYKFFFTRMNNLFESKEIEWDRQIMMKLV